jgi:hypothetical protein
LAGECVEWRLAAVLAADIAGYSRLMGADEERTLARLPPIAVMPSSYFEPLSFETAGSLICLNTRLALDVGVFRTGELAARKRDEHGRVLAVAAILVAELQDQIVLF